MWVVGVLGSCMEGLVYTKITLLGVFVVALKVGLL